MFNIKGKKIVNFIGPSGAGKTSLGKELLKLGYPELVSHTSRKIRLHDGEVDGVSYHFTTEDKMIEMEQQNDFIEYAMYSGNHYGLSKTEVENKMNMKDVVFVITNKEGNLHLKNYFGENVVQTIFVYVEPEVLKERLSLRGDSEEAIKERIENIKKTNEMDNYKISDFIIYNKDYQEAKNKLFSIVKLIEEELKA